MYDLVIIGGGPAGIGAGVYAARKKIETLLVASSFGGQSIVSNDVQNWIGTVSISGFDLGQNLEAHLRAQQDIEIEKHKSLASEEGGQAQIKNLAKTLEASFNRVLDPLMKKIEQNSEIMTEIARLIPKKRVINIQKKNDGYVATSTLQ